MSLVETWEAACMANESGPDTWNVLSRAPMDGCGLSFGVNQFDLHTNQTARSALGRILRRAKAAEPGLDITEAQIATIEAGGLSDVAASIADDSPAGQLIRPVNQALATEAGKAALKAESDTALIKDVTEFEAWREGLVDGELGSKALLRASLAAQLLCLDFFNLFGPPTKISVFLCGGSVALNDKQNHPEPVVARTSLTDLLRYQLATRQGSGPRSDQQPEILRRMNNVLLLSRPATGWPLWRDKDKAWFRTKLRPILDTPGVIAERRANGLYGELVPLTKI
ncbi:hypothetical protein PMI01_00630 [Caulobacter sp. AP07]|uniref:hypothetical protein n=1 Tax=Caulobacter sp. AP07 TaxID=1144304 RepID=UPI000271ED52|nr:hypothetical protein [Caulobacter sp. AP07]EJL37552.1 hypothetical protein PMI01_00630 [Caulobacter sp. AP07]